MEKNQAGKGNTVSGQNAAGTATPADTQPGADTSTQQPASGTIRRQYSGRRKYIHRNNAASGGSSSGGGSSADSSSSSGGGAPAEIQHLPVGMVVQIRLVEQQAHHQQEQIQEAMWEVEILQEEVRIRIYLPVDHQAVPEVPAVHRTVGHLLVVENSDSDSGNSGSGSSGGDGEDIGWMDQMIFL